MAKYQISRAHNAGGAFQPIVVDASTEQIATNVAQAISSLLGVAMRLERADDASMNWAITPGAIIVSGTGIVGGEYASAPVTLR